MSAGAIQIQNPRFSINSEVKGKGKDLPGTYHEGPEGAADI